MTKLPSSHLPTVGFRNHNPLNLRYVESIPWFGQLGMGELGFAEFQGPFWGLRAAGLDLFNKIKSGLNTLPKITRVWAPYGDGANDPVIYAQSVSKWTGIPLDATINPGVDSIVVLLKGMCRMENGSVIYSDALIRYAAEVACGATPCPPLSFNPDADWQHMLYNAPPAPAPQPEPADAKADRDFWSVVSGLAGWAKRLIGL